MKNQQITEFWAGLFICVLALSCCAVVASAAWAFVRWAVAP